MKRMIAAVHSLLDIVTVPNSVNAYNNRISNGDKVNLVPHLDPVNGKCGIACVVRF